MSCSGPNHTFWRTYVLCLCLTFPIPFAEYQRAEAARQNEMNDWIKFSTTQMSLAQRIDEIQKSRMRTYHCKPKWSVIRLRKCPYAGERPNAIQLLRMCTYKSLLPAYSDKRARRLNFKHVMQLTKCTTKRRCRIWTRGLLMVTHHCNPRKHYNFFLTLLIKVCSNSFAQFEKKSWHCHRTTHWTKLWNLSSARSPDVVKELHTELEVLTLLKSQ